MSEVKLNLIDTHKIITGTIHGSVADSCVAALSAEPETIEELEAALARYLKPRESWSPFAWFHRRLEVDTEPWDAGLVIIDLASRIVAVESSYSMPPPEGEVGYHNGEHLTDVSVLYRVPADWLFVNSAEAHRWSCQRRRQQRAMNPPFDARAILYGPPLLEFIANAGVNELERPLDQNDQASGEASRKISEIHATWLMTPRDDLGGRPPREVLLEKQDFIDFDLHTRCLQWTFQGEGPPCLGPDSFAYRFAGFGTHEWVIYYDLVRHLLHRAVEISSRSKAVSAARRHFVPGSSNPQRQSLVEQLEKLKSDWLEQPQDDFDGRIPAILIENERKRLPQAISPSEMIIDDDCEICRASAFHAEMGFGPGFWHLDGCNMDDGFAFSTCLTTEQWEAEIREREEFNRKFEHERAERRERIARGEVVADEFGRERVGMPKRDNFETDSDLPF